MPSILTNHEAERLILDIRAGRAAAAAETDHRPGALLVFPTSVVIAVPGRGHNVFPLRTTAEPGMSCREDGWSSVIGDVDGVAVEGTFWWSMDQAVDARGCPPAAVYRFRRGRDEIARPAWADQLPRSQLLTAVPGPALARHRLRLRSRGRAAEHEMLSRTAAVFEYYCRGPLGRAIAVRPALEVADVVQRAMQVAGRLLPLYASPARPPCSWLGMIQLDGRRDLHRALTQLDWLPRDLVEVLGRMETADIVADKDPTVTLASIIDAAVEHHRPVPRATPRQVAAALATPRLVSLENLPASHHDALCRPDRRLEATDNEPGALTARVAHLVLAEPGLAVRAWLGDDGVIDRIGDRVIAVLRRPGETKTATRRRCRQEFRAFGKLFSSTDGLQGFGRQAPARHLAAIDATLAALAGRSAG